LELKTVLGEEPIHAKSSLLPPRSWQNGSRETWANNKPSRILLANLGVNINLPLIHEQSNFCKKAKAFSHGNGTATEKAFTSVGVPIPWERNSFYPTSQLKIPVKSKMLAVDLKILESSMMKYRYPNHPGNNVHII
jgi:hypothetical protein